MGGRLFHQTDTILHNARGEVVLASGDHNSYGKGVYFSGDGEYYFRREATYVVDRSLLEEAGIGVVECDHNIYRTDCLAVAGRVRKSRRSAPDGGTLYRIVKVRKLKAGADYAAHLSVANHRRQKPLSARSVKALERKYAPSSCQGPRYRLLGVLLGLLSLAVWLLKRSPMRWKWYSLGRFLIGIGGEFRIPDEIARDWSSGIVDGTFIRPSADTALFWMVGGMNVDRSDDGKLRGVDVYDFHAQPGGQHTIRGSGFGWAWSGGVDDPTRIPDRIVFLKVSGTVRRLFPKLWGRYIREEGGYVLFSNDLWNALGGKPFKSVLEIELH